jgi:hypothetical protein
MLSVAVRKVMRPPSRFLFPALALCGLVTLSYLFGAAAFFFRLPPTETLHKAFVGAQAWLERKQALTPVEGVPPPLSRDRVDRPGQTFDGFTLYASAPGTHASLINMRGEVVHQWNTSFSRVWPAPAHVREPVKDSLVYPFACHLYPNGELLVVFQGPGNPFYGYGLVKLDRDSTVIWYDGNIHHDVDVGEDGTIYALQQELTAWAPRELSFIPTPCLVDFLVLLSPHGRELSRIPLLQAIRDSPYCPFLSALERRRIDAPNADDDRRRRDVLHTNCVRVLSRELAPNFPMFKAGQVLISMRHLDTIAVLDTSSRSLVWAARGPWKGQHDPQFLANGRLLLFDNLGSPRSSRVSNTIRRPRLYPGSIRTWARRCSFVSAALA